MPDPALPAAAFRALEARLRARRLSRIDPGLAAQLVLLALLLGGYLWIEARGILQQVALDHGPLAAAGAALATGAGLALLAALRVRGRHAALLRGPTGPAWLALPLSPEAIAAHLAWVARHEAAWFALPALAVLVATVGLVPPLAVAALAAAQALGFVAAARAGTRLGRAAVLGPALPPPALPPLWRALAVPPGRGPRGRLPAARWRRVPAWRALVERDRLATARLPRLREAATIALAVGVVSWLGWLVPGETARAVPGAPDLRHLATFFVALLAGVSLAQWLVALVGSDPFAALRALPLGLATVWRARVAWAVAFALVLVAGHALLARGVATGPLVLYLAWVAGATAGMGVLGVNLAMTLYPDATAAGRVLGLAFVLMAIASAAIFLSGWVVLLVAIAWTARRLPRWERMTEA